MNELIKLIEKPSFVNFDHLRISIASPDEIISWSHGEIKKPCLLYTSDAADE